MDTSTFELKSDINGRMHVSLKHDSAHKHVSGEAEYIDDIPEMAGTLHGAVGLSTCAHGEIVAIDLEAVRAAPGVVRVFTGKDVPGVNDVSPGGRHDEPLLATDRVEFHGQPIFAVIAESREAARRAARLAKIEYKPLPHYLDVDSARQNGGALVTEPMTLKRGEPETELDKPPFRLQGRMAIGGQEHFYLEGHIAMAIPGEDEEVIVWSSTQHPSEVQHMVGHVLGIPSNAVTVQTRRMGGGFGGKETQGNQFAALAALAAKTLKRPVKFRPDRDEDMVMTGKRHDFVVDYDVAYDGDGRIHAVDATFAARCGFSSDLSGPVTDRALFHADSSYFYPHVKLTSQPLKTHTVSNTAFRGFGGPQGMVGGERIIEEIAYATGKDPLDIRKANFYGQPGSGRDLTPYHQQVQDNIIARLVDELEHSSDYRARRQAGGEHRADREHRQHGGELEGLDARRLYGRGREQEADPGQPVAEFGDDEAPRPGADRHLVGRCLHEDAAEPCAGAMDDECHRRPDSYDEMRQPDGRDEADQRHEQRHSIGGREPRARIMHEEFVVEARAGAGRRCQPLAVIAHRPRDRAPPLRAFAVHGDLVARSGFRCDLHAWTLRDSPLMWRNVRALRVFNLTGDGLSPLSKRWLTDGRSRFRNCGTSRGRAVRDPRCGRPALPRLRRGAARQAAAA